MRSKKTSDAPGGACRFLLFMQVINEPRDLSDLADSWRRAGETIALVPTMGYYHKGHEALMEKGRGLADHLVVSLFVNPAQFGPNEDLDAYPRDLERDARIARERGADVLFAPEAASLYLPGHATWVEVPELASGLCGRSRPVHFRGVCTIVLKLFLLSRANFAVFGEKDWQQLAIVRRMANDLNLPTRIVSCPTVREDDGLALSSRNVYMNEDERAQAPGIRKGLLLARDMAEGGERDAERLRSAVLAYWARNLPLGRLDYLNVVDPDSLAPCNDISGPALMACAVRLGRARLIDNILLRA